MKNFISLIFLTSILVGCGPADGPSVAQVNSQARQSNIPIFTLTPEVLDVLGRSGSETALSELPYSNHQVGVIRPGDTISVSFFDTDDQALFSASNSSALPLGEFVVSESGSVGLPYIGTFNLAGRSVLSAQNALTAKLRENSANPYVSINIIDKASDSFTVQGGVNDGGAYPLTTRTEKVLDAIAAAGGPSGSPDDTVVTVIRNGKTASQSMAHIMSNSAENIKLLPGDVLVLDGGEAAFIADGAINSPGEFPFVEGQFSLAQAVAMAGGLQDKRSNPKAVFIFRHLPEGEFIRLKNPDNTFNDIYGDVVFRANFADFRERLAADRFQLRDRDLLYVGNVFFADNSLQN